MTFAQAVHAVGFAVLLLIYQDTPVSEGTNTKVAHEGLLHHAGGFLPAMFQAVALNAAVPNVSIGGNSSQHHAFAMEDLQRKRMNDTTECGHCHAVFKMHLMHN